jgi:pimeloyl-ACP methyl ester carboxylesterase
MSAINNVVCVHGFWSHGAGMFLIKRRLEKEYGLRVLLFSYPSVRDTLDENAASLARFIGEQQLGSTHIIGHSLGGVVALRMYANNPDVAPGRLVCLGSPLSGSRAADFLSEQDWAEPILGHSLSAGVVHSQFVANFDEPHDGTVAVSETRLAGAADHLVMEVSHNGMLVSSDVADQAAAFLKRGTFLREAV